MYEYSDFRSKPLSSKLRECSAELRKRSGALIIKRAAVSFAKSLSDNELYQPVLYLAAEEQN